MGQDLSEGIDGFRPGRSAYQAIARVQAYLEEGYSWVVDLDLEKVFDAIDHPWLLKFVEHRIGDRRVVRHIRKWLKAGVLEEDDGTRRKKARHKGEA